MVCDFDWDATDTEDDEEDDRVELDIHARAHREIAFSTPADIAPRRPPKTDRLELELEEVEDEEEDDIPKEEPKAKNPLDSLPKSTFNLEDWKRAYSNKDTRGADGSLEWVYKKCVCVLLSAGFC